MQESLAVADRLPGQAQLQITAVAGDHADGADHVVDGLGPGTEHCWCDCGEVVLAVDPLGDDQGRGQDGLQGRPVGIDLGLVGVQECPTLQIYSPGHRARRDDEGGVTGQSPLRIHLRPVG